MFLHPTKGKSKTNLKQCWFPGVHSDVGGSYLDAQAVDSSDISLAWMIAQCGDMLKFDRYQINRFTGDSQHPPPGLDNRPSMYAAMPSHDSVKGVFLAQGRSSRTPGQYQLRDPLSPSVDRTGATNETIHPSVRIRLLKLHDKAGRWKKNQLPRRVIPKLGWYNPARLWTKPVEIGGSKGYFEYTLEWDAQALAGWKLVCAEKENGKLAWKWVKEDGGSRIEIAEWEIEEGSLESRLLQKEDRALLHNFQATDALPIVKARLGVIGAVRWAVSSTGSGIYGAFSSTGSAISSVFARHPPQGTIRLGSEV
jgi:Uncharacterized alpha/beta hydrolase domain (DUF2235)